MRFNFCPECGEATAQRLIEGRTRRICTRCDRILYSQLIVGAGGVLELDQRLLLIRRTHAPFEGLWCLPAGHVDDDEDPGMAAQREIEEETGLIVNITELIDAYFFDDHPKGCGVFLVYRCVPVAGTLISTEEGMTPTFFSRTEVPVDVAGGGHSAAIHAWISASQ